MTDSVNEAISKAKYNEAVVISVADDEGTSNEIVLIPVLDFQNGGVTWEVAGTSTSDDIDVGIQRHLQTKKWIIPMLNDTHRNTIYNAAIQKACVESFNTSIYGRGKDEVIHILDIGSGTGLLAMIAARGMLNIADECKLSVDVKVIAVEMASAMKRLCDLTIKENNLQNFVDVIEQHSCDADFDPFPSYKPILCTSELLESGLLGEGILPALRDAWARHLDYNSIIIPQRARVYAQVVEGLNYVNKFRGPDYENQYGSIKMNTTGYEDHKLLGGGGFVVPIHAAAMISDTKKSQFILGKGPSDESAIEKITFLTEPVMALDFDFTCKERFPPPTGRSISIEMTAKESGTAHGVYFWWELDLYDNITYSTKLGASPWQDHWQQCLFIFGNDDEGCLKLNLGQDFQMVASHDETSITFSLIDSPNPTSYHLQKKTKIREDIQRHISPYRALQLNDMARMTVIRKGIQYALTEKGIDANFLDLSDFSLCSLIAAKEFGAKYVSSLESSSNNVPMLSALVAQVGNMLPQEGCNFQVINSHAEALTLDIIYDMMVDIVVAEPYFDVFEGWHLLEALNYFYTLRNLRNKGIICTEAVSVPFNAVIRACAIEFSDDIMRSHCKLESSIIEGFSHKVVQEYSKLQSSFDMKFPLVQYEWKRLSENIDIGYLNYMDCKEYNASSRRLKLDIGTCHAIVVWVDYGIQISNSQTEYVTTGNKYHHQIVRFLKEPIHVKTKGDVCIQVKIVFANDLNNGHDFDIQIVSEGT